MNETNSVKGFKVFGHDWTCSPNGNKKQYACPGKFEEDVIPSVCGKGMHFCKKPADCFRYHSFDHKNKVAEVIAYGDIAEDGDKCCTNKLEIVREIPWSELLEIVNTGNGCTGLCNSGNRNSGDWNTCNFSNGCFNTIEPRIYLFNKPSEWTYLNWIESEAFRLLLQMPCGIEYISFSDMTEEEKAEHPEAETMGGYLKKEDRFQCASIWWRELPDSQKAVITAIPNFDRKIFKEITGIDVEEAQCV